MYPSVFKEEFPCGIGFEWNIEKDVFRKKLMTVNKISIGSVEWIDFMRNDDRLIDADGTRQTIQSGWTGNEKKVGQYLVDGYCVVGDKTYVLEFDGCFFHQCEDCGFVKTDAFKRV